MPVQVMPDDHSKLVPPLPIPNRTVKQLCADDSAATSVKVGYRQACYLEKQPPAVSPGENPISNGRVFFRLAVWQVLQHTGIKKAALRAAFVIYQTH